MGRDATERDIDGIVAGLGGRNKFRFGRGADGVTHLLRSTHGHSRELGVEEDALPVDEEVLYVAHGTSMEDARDIVVNGLNRCARLHIHFHPCDVAGKLADSPQMRHGARVVIVVSAAHAREEGLIFYRSSNNVILSSGEHGIIPPRFIRRAIRYTSSEKLWASQTRQWRYTKGIRLQPAVNGNLVDDDESGSEDDQSQPIARKEPKAFGKELNHLSRDRSGNSNLHTDMYHMGENVDLSRGEQPDVTGDHQKVGETQA